MSFFENIASGTITRVEGGTIGSILGIGGTVTTTGGGAGSTVVTVGTINAGTLNNLASGSTVQTAGTLTTGTLQNLVSGSVVQTAGTLTTGSVVQTAGTLTTGTLQNLVSGTVVQASGTLTTGSIVQTAGTLTTMIAGTLTALANGTITAGTIRQQWQAVTQVTSFGTLGTAGGSFFGTLSGTSGGGTKHIVSGCSIVVATGTADVRVLIGSAIIGGSVLTAGFFPPGGGIARDFNPPIESGTNSELIYHFVGAGTAYITVQYWKSIL